MVCGLQPYFITPKLQHKACLRPNVKYGQRLYYGQLFWCRLFPHYRNKVNTDVLYYGQPLFKATKSTVFGIKYLPVSISKVREHVKVDTTTSCFVAVENSPNIALH